MNDKKVLWDEFWEKYNILKNGAPLFETKMSLCRTWVQRVSANSRLQLRRRFKPEMEHIIKHVKGQ